MEKYPGELITVRSTGATNSPIKKIEVDFLGNRSQDLKPMEPVVTVSLNWLCLSPKLATSTFWLETNQAKKQIFYFKHQTLFGKFITTTEELPHMAIWTETKRSPELSKPHTIDP